MIIVVHTRRHAHCRNVKCYQLNNLDEVNMGVLCTIPPTLGKFITSYFLKSTYNVQCLKGYMRKC